MAGEPGEILGLAPGQAASDELRASRIHDLIREHSRREGDDTRPDARRGLDGYLLADNRARQGEERLAAGLERDARMITDESCEHDIAARERAPGPVPVRKCRHARAASPTRSERQTKAKI